MDFVVMAAEGKKIAEAIEPDAEKFRISHEMMRRGVAAYFAFDYSKEEPESLISQIFDIARKEWQRVT